MDVRTPKRTVLVHEYLSGGGLHDCDQLSSLVTEGIAMRNAVAADFQRQAGVCVLTTLDARLPEEHESWKTVPVKPGEEEPTFRRLTAEVDCTVLIAPETEDILLKRTQTIDQFGGRSLGSTPGAVALCGDKALLGKYLSERGISLPYSQVVRPSDGLPREFPYPAVLKPIDGAGALNTYVIGHAANLPAETIGMERALLQTFTAGTPLSVSLIVAPDQRVTVVGVARQEIRIQGGQVSYLGGTVPFSPGPPLEEVLHAVSLVRGLRGWVGVDFLWNEAESLVTILEINPRLTTSYVGFRRLLPEGELARAWLSAFDDPSGLRGFDLAKRVDASAPLSFAANGVIRDEAPVP
jgi:tyramine---L-glutamate ligase